MEQKVESRVDPTKQKEDIKEQKVKKPSKKKWLPRAVLLARIFGLYLPAKKRQENSTDMIEYILDQVDLKSVVKKPLPLRALFLENKGIWPLGCRFEYENEKKQGFFIPAPWQPQRCKNSLTTLLSDVSLLCKNLTVSIRELDRKEISQAALKNRQVVAFGTAQSYRIYQLEELTLAWQSLHVAAIPESPLYVFKQYQIEGLKTLLKNEYDNGTAKQLLQTIFGLSQSREKEKTTVNELVENFKQLNEKQQVQCQRFFQWVLLASLFMRGWNLNINEFALEEKACTKVRQKSQEQSRLTYAIGRLYELIHEFDIPTSHFIFKLPIINIFQTTVKGIVSDNEDEESSEEEGDEIEEDESDDDEASDIECMSSNDENDNTQKEDKRGIKTETTSTIDKKETKVQKPNVSQLCKEMMEKLFTSQVDAKTIKDKTIKDNTIKDNTIKTEDKTIEDKTKQGDSINIKLPDCHVEICHYEKNFIHSLQRVMDGVWCFREASRELLQTSAFYLETFCRQTIPKLPLVCVERIQ
jgi:hypothetical protein